MMSAVAELSNPRNQRRDPSGDTTTPDVEWLPLKDPEDMDRADLSPALKATVAPAAVADQAAQAEEDTVNSRLPNAVPLLRDTVNSAVLNALRDTANSRLPRDVPLRDTANSAVLNALRDTASRALLNAVPLRDTLNSRPDSRRWCRDANKPDLALLKEADTDSSSALPSRDVPLEDTDSSSSVLPARARASAALAPVVVRTPADMATLVKDQTRLPKDLLVFARDSKAKQAKQNNPRAIDQADTAARLKLLLSVLRDTALQRDVRLLNAVDTVVQPRFALQRLQ